MNIKKMALLLFLAILFAQCRISTEEITYPWYVDNRADFPISTYLAWGCYDFSPSAYPDTTLPICRNIGINSIDASKKVLVWESLDREELVKASPLDTLSVFILHSDTLQKYTWEKIREAYMILVRYDLSYDDLRKLNFCIPYPPTDSMENMRIYWPMAGQD